MHSYLNLFLVVFHAFVIANAFRGGFQQFRLVAGLWNVIVGIYEGVRHLTFEISPPALFLAFQLFNCLYTEVVLFLQALDECLVVEVNT